MGNFTNAVFYINKEQLIPLGTYSAVTTAHLSKDNAAMLTCLHAKETLCTPREKILNGRRYGVAHGCISPVTDREILIFASKSERRRIRAFISVSTFVFWTVFV